MFSKVSTSDAAPESSTSSISYLAVINTLRRRSRIFFCSAIGLAYISTLLYFYFIAAVFVTLRTQHDHVSHHTLSKDCIAAVEDVIGEVPLITSAYSAIVQKYEAPDTSRHYIAASKERASELIAEVLLFAKKAETSLHESHQPAIAKTSLEAVRGHLIAMSSALRLSKKALRVLIERELSQLARSGRAPETTTSVDGVPQVDATSDHQLSDESIKRSEVRREESLTLMRSLDDLERMTEVAVDRVNRVVE